MGDAPFASSSPDRPDVVVVGDVMADVSVEAGALAVGGDVHGEVRIRPGGTASNAAVWAAADGARVRVHGRVGDDLMGRLIQEALEEQGVEAALAVDPAARTGSMLVVHGPGERSMVADRGANGGLSPGDVPGRLEAGAVLVSGYLLLHEGSNAGALAALDRAQAPFVAVDAASWPLIGAFGQAAFFEATRRANFLLLNEVESATLTLAMGGQAFRKLRSHFEHFCLKRGASGATLVLSGGRPISCAPPKIDEMDPTGAGDAFDGVLLGALARGVAAGEALQRACAAGARAAAGPDPWPPR